MCKLGADDIGDYAPKGMSMGEILAMKAGDELDALVASSIFECSVQWVDQAGIRYPYCGCRYRPHKRPDTASYWSDLARYSTDILPAWQVVDKMSQLAYDMSLLLHSVRTEPILHVYLPPDWYCDFRPRGENVPPGYEWVDHQKTAPEAICKAALLAITKEP